MMMMKPVPRTLRLLLAGSVALSTLGLADATRADVCRQDGQDFAGDCTHRGAGTVVSMPVQSNVADGPAPDLGEVGFSISIDAAPAGGADVAPASTSGPADKAAQITSGPRRTIAGAPARDDGLRRVDRLLDQAGVDLTYDGLGVRPRLAIATADLREGHLAGEAITFRASSNYPAWIARAELVIADSEGDTVARLPIAPNGTVAWVMPATGDEHYSYQLRAFDSEGRRDETHRLALRRVAERIDPELDGPVIAAGEGEDMLARRGIPVRGGAITVSGRSNSNLVRVLGETIPVDASGGFVTQRILPPGVHAVAIQVDGRPLERSVTIEKSEWFATGIADLTVGHDDQGTWRLGRIAGYADGRLANGLRVRASVDTREEELRDMFRNFGRKNPDQTLREMKAGDVFATFGDDSSTTELAPSSGKMFLRLDKDLSHLQWGDFKPREDLDLTVRSERALYGLSGRWASTSVTGEGESRASVTAFGAQADSLFSRDVLRATGGSAYVLSHQDILSGSESISVQIVSRTTGLVVETRRLSEGTDYRINPVQGVVILNQPLASSASGGGLVGTNPGGDHDVNLVAQYEYVPTTGDIDGYTAGARGEAWVNDNLRLGASVLRETTGIADNTLIGADVLLRQGESRELLLEHATSEGPGFGSNFSLNGGMDLEPGNPSYGLPGQTAQSWKLSGRTDLGFLGLDGRIEGHVDRKEAGFSSPDQDFEYDQDAWGLSGRVALNQATELTFGTEGLRREDGKREHVGRIGLAHQFKPDWLLEAEIAQDRREGDASLTDQGKRVDAAVRAIWKRDEDLSVWLFGQSTLSRDATRLRNDRVGAGASLRISDRADLVIEGSDGSLGAAGRVELGWRRDANTTSSIGYVLDPTRRLDRSTFSGRDRGSLVFSTDSKVNDRWAYTSETLYSAFGTTPTATTNYGVTYTPSETWRIDAMLRFGESREDDGTELVRRGISLGASHKDGDRLSAGVKGEWTRETSNRPGDELDRKTWLLSGWYEAKVSENWRFVSSLDAVVSDSDQSSWRDGRYVEANIGYAWRPAENDHVNALFSYTWLYDLPGADQVNIDGETEGDRQRSHILNAAVNWQVDPVWTLGAKYGYRKRESAARGSNDFIDSEAHLVVLRADMHIIHNWDLMAEVRQLHSPTSGMTESAALIGVHRLVGNHLRIGGGYLHGEVDDDLRTIKAPKSGLFLNLTSQF